MPEAIPDPVDAAGDADGLRAELERLREQLSTALDAARSAELATGVLRGELAELQVQLARARQEQEWALTARHPRTTRWWARAHETMDTARNRITQRLQR